MRLWAPNNIILVTMAPDDFVHVTLAIGDIIPVIDPQQIDTIRVST